MYYPKFALCLFTGKKLVIHFKDLHGASDATTVRSHLGPAVLYRIYSLTAHRQMLMEDNLLKLIGLYEIKHIALRKSTFKEKIIEDNFVI